MKFKVEGSKFKVETGALKWNSPKEFLNPGVHFFQGSPNKYYQYILFPGKIFSVKHGIVKPLQAKPAFQPAQLINWVLINS
jgi:hypothetical protein